MKYLQFRVSNTSLHYSIVPIFQSPLLAFELRGSLLEIGFYAFLTVFAREGLRQKLSFESKAIGQGQFETGLDRTLDLTDGHTALVRDDELPGVVHDLLHEVFFVINVMHQTHVQSFLKGDGFSRRAQLHAAGLADQARQSLGAAHARHHAEVDLGQPDAAAFFLSNADVAGNGDFQPAADRMAIDGRDDNLGGILKAHKDLAPMESYIISIRDALAI